jgi:hypothetical protein
MAHLVDLPSHADARGRLCVLEKIVPFPIRRVYFIRTPTGVRGGHRHKKNRQLMVAVVGRARIQVNDGKRTATFLLESPTRGLVLETQDWHTMDDFSPDCALLVLASEPYDVNDYIDEPYPHD